MDLSNVVISMITGVITVFSEKCRLEKMQNRKYYGLSLCIDGQITYIQEGREYVSDPSTAIILPKNQSYFIRGDSTGHFPVINFDCTEFLCDTITVINIQERQQLLSDYERLKNLICFDGSRPKIFSIFYDMLHKLCIGNIPYELRRAVQIIKNDYTDPNLTNSIIANECNISEVYFRQLFKKHFKTSPKQFIIDLRLQKAKQLLSEGSLKLSAISESCGFSNPYHFCRTFRLHTGSTPSEYRTNNKIYKI